jgi:hypothetical protein
MNNDTVTVDAVKWHKICHELKLEDRSKDFQEYFNCKLKWKSRLDEWPGEDASEIPNPVMVLTFTDPKEASLFVLKFL